MDDLEKLFNLVHCEKEDYPINYDDVGRSVSALIVSLGKAMNCLKSKAWKQTHMLTDKEKFYDKIAETFYRFMELSKGSGLTPNELSDLYFRKSIVNLFRQNSNY